MKALILPLAIAAFLPYVFTVLSKVGAMKAEDNAAIREWALTLQGWRKRAYWTQLNLLEGFPLYAAAILCAMINATPAHYCIALDIAWAYIGLRLVYGALYIGDKPSMRSIVWFLCQISCAALFVVSALH